MFKCDFCCAVATYDCSGVHFCDPCHGGGGWRGRNNDERTQKCLGRPGDRCPLGKRHPKNGARESRNFVIGCAKCLGIEGREAFASRGTEQQWARDRAKAKKRKEAVVLKTGLLQLRVTVREWTLSGLTRVEVVHIAVHARREPRVVRVRAVLARPRRGAGRRRHRPVGVHSFVHSARSLVCVWGLFLYLPLQYLTVL